jgi:hypothetical protein
MIVEKTRHCGHAWEKGLAGHIRKSGRRGGMMGGPGGLLRGSIAGDTGLCRLNGLMMIGGTVGGADGGPFGPLLAKPPRAMARWSHVA